MAGRNDGLLKGAGRLMDDLAVARPDGEAARSALPVAFIGGDEMLIVEPRHGVRLTRDGRQAAGEIQLAVLGDVDAVKIDRAGRKARGDATVGADHHQMIVFLKRDHQIAGGIIAQIFRLGVIARNPGQPGQIDDRLAGAVQHAIGDRENRHEPGRTLRHGAVIHLFVALILDGDGDPAAVLIACQRIGLATQIAACQHLAPRQIDAAQRPRRIGPALRGVHADKAGAADDDRRCRLALHGDLPQRFRRVRVGNIDQAKRLIGAVGIDQRHAVLTDGHDLGRGFAQRIRALGQVLRHRERGDAVEKRRGHRRHGGGDGKRRNGGQAEEHENLGR